MQNAHFPQLEKVVQLRRNWLAIACASRGQSAARLDYFGRLQGTGDSGMNVAAVYNR